MDEGSLFVHAYNAQVPFLELASTSSYPQLTEPEYPTLSLGLSSTCVAGTDLLVLADGEVGRGEGENYSKVFVETCSFYETSKIESIFS